MRSFGSSVKSILRSVSNLFTCHQALLSSSIARGKRVYDRGPSGLQFVPKGKIETFRAQRGSLLGETPFFILPKSLSQETADLTRKDAPIGSKTMAQNGQKQSDGGKAWLVNFRHHRSGNQSRDIG